jgi:AraC-like DNA-binding protein
MQITFHPGPDSLRDLVYATLTRRTAAVPASGFRLNRCPPLAFCSLTFIFQGRVQCAPPGVLATAPDAGFVTAPDCFVSGINHLPFHTFDLTTVDALSVAFYPPAFCSMLNVSADSLVHKLISAQEIFGEDIAGLYDELARIEDDAQRLSVLYTYLERHWQQFEGRQQLPYNKLNRLIARTRVHALTFLFQVRERTLERIFHKQYGASPSKLKRIGRAREAFFAARKRQVAGQPINFAAIAAELGYSDQSHLNKETVAATGHAPGELARLVENDESFWIYRLPMLEDADER